MTDNFTAQVTNNRARESIRPDFILSGNQNRQLIQSSKEENVIYLGEETGTVNILAAKTIRFGTNTIHPDGQGTGTNSGFMELPTKWGFNGMYLGITGGRLDWIDPLEIFKTDNNSVFGFANYGTSTKINNDYTDLELTNYYENFRNIPEQNTSGLPQDIVESTTLLSDISNIRLSSTIGLFNTAGGFSSTAIGWENLVNNNFSILIGTNLDLSATRIVNDICGGEIVLGASNVKYDDRDISHIDRILTIGNGDISNNVDAIRSDAFFILKSGDSVFKNKLDICDNVHMYSDLHTDGDITTRMINSRNGISGESVIANLLLKSNMSDLETIVGHVPIGGATSNDNNTGTIRFGVENGLRINKYANISGKLAQHVDEGFTSNELAKNNIRIENSSGIQMYTTRPSGGGIDRNAYGTIQILHPDAYHIDNSNITGFSGEILQPPTIKMPFRGTHLTWWGISSEDVSFSTATIGGLNLPPSNHQGDNSQEGAPPSISDHTGKVLVNNGDGTCKWTTVSIDTEADISLSQMKDVFEDVNYNLVIGKEREDLLYDFSGIRSNNLLLDNSQVVLGNSIIHKDLSVNENVFIGGRTKIFNSLDISDNLDLSGNIKILGKSTIHNSLDLSGNLFTDSAIYSRDKITGHNGLEISGNVDISGSVDISGTLKVDSSADISGDLEIYGDKTRVEKIIVDQNIYFSNTENMTTDRLDIKSRIDNSDISALSLLEFVNNQVANAISNTITNPAGSIIWMARDPDKIPINYLIANGQYVGQSSYNALYDALPGYISNINNDITRYPKLTIEISQSDPDIYPLYPSSVGDEGIICGFSGILNHNYYNNYYDVKTKLFTAIAHDNIRIELSGNNTNKIDSIRFKTIPIQNAALRKYTGSDFEASVLSDQAGNATQGSMVTSHIKETIVSWSDFSQNIFSNGYYDISSSIPNLDTTIYRFFILHVETSSVDNPGVFNQFIYKTDWGSLPTASQDVTNPIFSENIYSNTYYNKYEEYSAPNRNDLVTTYFKIPNLIGRFIRGGETNIGNYYEDTLKNHKHESLGHKHNFLIDDPNSLTHSHNYAGATTFNGIQVPNHNHTFPAETIDVSFEMIKSGTSSTRSVDLGKLLVHPQSNDPGNQYLTSGGATNIITSNAGGHIPSGTVNIEPVDTTLSINVTQNTSNSNINTSFEDISGILDMNKQPLIESNETRPKHVILLPCIAIGTNNVQASSSNLENYSVEARVNILENRANNFDICLNSARINIHSFTENPSGTGLEAT